jgi:pimeloyl-ACP methyl ester carboxylesterase
LWGEHDAALGIELLEGLEEYAPAVRVHVVAGVSHWIQNEAPDEVNRAILEFLAEPSGH